ncbi:MAG: hypothetical protein QNJ78_08675 [Gammaproteobacteria bacterium]|nr:hypothetical protein [Gammaproteobacteria bacterium]
MAQSAKVAYLALEAFIELLDEVGVPAVDYPTEELDDELTVALSQGLSLPIPGR